MNKFSELTDTKTILIVEDEPLLRDMAVRTLKQYNYTIMEAANGKDALDIADSHPAKIDLLLTDIVMPHMGGKALGDRLRIVRPEMKIIFTSGYTDDKTVLQGNFDPGIIFLQKPYTPTTLVKCVNELLEPAED